MPSMLRKIPNHILGVSEPNPAWFGNRPNEPSNPSWTNRNWLKSRFHFSFAEYNNPRNMGFGVVRVLNDDLVQPQRGFGEHPHSNVEICTYVVEGSLTHQDSMGTEESLTRGAIQFMTAGHGIWINTRARNLPPNYGSASCPPESRRNKWNHMVSDVENKMVDTAIKINQDANLFVTELDPGSSASLSIGKGRQGYLVCIEGSAVLTGTNGIEETVVERHDAAEVYGETELTVTAAAKAPSHVLVIEMEYTGKGRTDI